MEPKYPEIEVQLTGEDGNAFRIISHTLRMMKRGGVPKEDQDAFQKEAMSGDYANVLNTVAKYVHVA